MLNILLFLLLVFFPVKSYAQTVTPEDTPTPMVTEVPTPTETPSPTVEPTSTPAPTNSPESSSPTSTPAPAATSKPVALPTKKQAMTNTQTGGFIGNGLVEEKDSPNQDGLSSGQTLGTATQDINSSGDKDLLSTLIFLTGAVVLVVWTVYAVLVQKGVIKTVKKKEHSGGITPQPLE